MEKRGLGRGLAALLSDALVEPNAQDTRELPLDQVVPNPYQPRTQFDAQKLEELTASVREHGVLQPVLARRIGHDRYQLIAGERRFRAAQAAGLRSIPALVRELSEQEQLEIALVENVQREDIGVMEAARAYRRLMDEFEMTQEMVAQRVGKSRSAIANLLRLLSLPEEVQESIERGEISEGHGRALMMAENPAAIRRAWQMVLQKRLTVRETEKLAREIKEGANVLSGGVSIPENKPERRQAASEVKSRNFASDPNLEGAADQLQQALGTKVTIRPGTGGAGRIEIEFYSFAELERLVELLLDRA
jgi:ParB family chromosome partitioning protein